MSEEEPKKKVVLPVELRGDCVEFPALMLVISHPNKDDLAARGFGEKGAAVNEIKQACANAGIPWEQVHITATIRHGIGSRSTPTKEEIEHYSATLDEEIQKYRPRLVMPMGAGPFKRMMKKNISMGDYLGEILPASPAIPYPMLANYAPGMMMADPTKRAEFQLIFKYAKAYIYGELKIQPYTWEVVTEPARNLEILQSYIDRGMFDIGYDAEWFGNHWRDDEVMFDFQYCCEPHHAIVLNISQDGKKENRELLSTMKLMLERPDCRRLGWNIRVDDIRLKHRGIEPLDETLAFDGMKAVQFFDSRLPKGLETGIKYFTDYERYYTGLSRQMKLHRLKKHEMAQMKFLEPEIYYKYCAGDAVSHREACLNMADQFPEHLKRQYYDIFLPLTHYMTDMEMTGIPIDKEVLTEITDLYKKKYEECLVALAECLKRNYNIENFNPNSAIQKKALLFETLKLPAAFYTKSGKSPKPAAWYEKQTEVIKVQYAPSTNAASLSTMQFQLDTAMKENPHPSFAAAFETVKLLLQTSRIGVFATKFLSTRGLDENGRPIPESKKKKGKKKKAKKPKGAEEEVEEVELDEDGEEVDEAIAELSENEEGEPLKQSYWSAINVDGCIHASFFECLKNFRASSSPNVQNPASKVLAHIPDIFVPGYNTMTKDEQKAVGHLIPKNLRNIFATQGKDFMWTELDVAGADLAIMAFLSKDKDFIFDIRSGSFHVTKMRDYFQDPTLSKKEVSKYTIAKSITFRVSYTAGLRSAALPIQAAIYAESGLAVPIELVDFALSTWSRYERYMKFRDECTDEVRERQQITNSRRQVLTYDETENFGVMAGWMNESLAFPVASELANFLWEASLNLKKELKKHGLWMKYVYPTNSVHDAGYWLVHKDLQKDNYITELLKYVFCTQTKLSTGDTVGCEVVLADRWKGKEKFFEGETRWCFETNQWLWK